LTEAHADKFLLKNRDTQSLRRKFNELVNSKKPTGDPSCPPHIRRAKAIQRMIIAKSDSGGGSLNDDDLGIGDDNDDDDVDPRNLQSALENTTTTSEADTNGNAMAPTLRSMVTPRRRNELGSSTGSYMEMMVVNMMERTQREEKHREQEERRREQEERRREYEYNERREERKAEQEERREERKAEQEERRLERQQQHQQMMMMMMAAFGGKKNNVDGFGVREEGGTQLD
jgi:flagellar biosynthesis GTPase FlhF